MAFAKVTAKLYCSICIKTYRQPVTLPCDHNFCRDCITRTWDHQEHPWEYKCPECQRIYRKRPELVRNTRLHSICETFHATIFCDFCNFAVLATKSCLQCETSLCDRHLRKYEKSRGHTLLPPTTDLGKWKCSVHKELLKYYCTEDAVCVCVSCSVIGGHVGHKMMSLDEAFEEKKKKLRNDLQRLLAEKELAEEIVQNLEECERKMQEKSDGEKKIDTALIKNLRKQLKNPKKRVQCLEEGKQKTQEKPDGEVERVTLPFKDLRRWLKDLEKRVPSVFTRQVQSYDDVIWHVKMKKEELSRKMRHIEELCNMTGPLTVLQESDTGDLCDTEDRHDKQLYEIRDLYLARISITEPSDIISGVTGGGYIDIECADILLNVNTAGNNLHISNDRKTVSWSDTLQIYPEAPERFQHPQVLSSQSFSSGGHYWEVDVGGSDSWRVGVCYPSIDRRGGQSWIGRNKKSWGLYRDTNQYSVTHDNKVIHLPYKSPSDRVRICLDYEAGQISFYALCDPIRHLHTFTATFTEPLHAVLLVFIGCIKLSGGMQET